MRKKSIIKVFVDFSVVALILLIISFSLMCYLFVSQGRIQKSLINRVSTANDIIVKIEDVKNDLNNYRHQWEEQYYKKYKEDIKGLDELTSLYLDRSDIFTERNMQEVRRLKNFIAYQEEMLDSSNIDKTELFNIVSYLLGGFDEHEKGLYSVLQSDIKAGYNEYFQREKSNILKMLALLLFFFLVVVALALWFTFQQRKILLYVNSLKEYLNEVSKQNWGVDDLKPTEFNEFEELRGSSLEMKNKLYTYFKKMEEKNEVERELAEEKIRNEKQHTELVKAEMSTLKSQINPHFLFNSLHQIGMASLVSEPKEILELVEATGKILRYSLDNKDGLVPLGKELDIVSTYIFLQEQYTENSFDSEIKCPEEIKDTLILPMCIQPLVENAFKHGLKNLKNRRGIIKVEAYTLDSFLYVSVYDNGNGFTEYSESESGIGLQNIKKRLELQFGISPLFFVDSKVGEYSKVTIREPIGEKNEGPNS